MTQGLTDHLWLGTSEQSKAWSTGSVIEGLVIETESIIPGQIEGAGLGEIYIRGALGGVAAIVGMVGAALSIAKPRRASIIMIVAGIVGLIFVDTGPDRIWELSLYLFGIAALLAFLGSVLWKKGKQT